MAKSTSSSSDGQLSLWNASSDYTSPFDALRHFDEFGREFWISRELRDALEYTNWRNFNKAIRKAKASLANTGIEPTECFDKIIKTIQMPKGGTKEVVDFKLTRLACYLIAMNCDPGKPVVAAAQQYFAEKTRKHELSEADKRAKAQLKHDQEVVIYQLRGKSAEWAEARVGAKEAIKEQNSAIHTYHETHHPNYGVITAEQNRALFDMSKREIIDYLGLLPKESDRYRDHLGKWANEAARLACKEIAYRIRRLNRDLTQEEIIDIVVKLSRHVAEHARAMAEFDREDYMSGAPLDDEGNALIQRNVRLIGPGL